MSAALHAAFAACKKEKRTAFVAFVTASYPTDDDTVPLLLALQNGGVDVIELGIPFSDPMADGTTIQKSSEVALAAGASLKKSFDLLEEARKQGLKVPVVMMGYLNPFLAMGFTELAVKSVAVGVSGFIVVDLPCDEAGDFISTCTEHGLAYVPLLSPTSTDKRMKEVAKLTSPFIYCVSVAGVTGARTSLADDLPEFIGRIKKHTSIPLAVGFGISKPEHVVEVGKHAEGVVVGSAVISAIESGKDPADRADKVQSLISTMTGRSGPVEAPDSSAAASPRAKRQRKEPAAANKKSKPGMYGSFGGRFIPETLVAAHEELEQQFHEAMKDKEFIKQMHELRTVYCGGPTPMYHAKRLTEDVGGAQIWFKQEHLAHTGAHKINNALGQVLLAKRLGKPRVIAETGAGQHGVATATACALLGVKCVVYMGQVDVERQSLNVFRMRVLGAEVHPVESGSKTLKDAINEAMRDWVTNVRDTHYCVGSAIGPHPFPLIVREFQSVIGKEAREQMLEKCGRLPDVAIACVGGGSNAIGLFHPFVEDKSVKLVGVEAGGINGPPGPHSSTLAAGVPGVLHGTRTYLIQDKEGQIEETHSISAGLDYPGVGPEHAFLKDCGRAEYVAVTDGQALEALQKVSKLEGIIPALEPSHALYHAIQRAKSMKKDEIVLVNLCGRGDKDMHTVAKALGVKIDWKNMF